MSNYKREKYFEYITDLLGGKRHIINRIDARNFMADKVDESKYYARFMFIGSLYNDVKIIYDEDTNLYDMHFRYLNNHGEVTNSEEIYGLDESEITGTFEQIADCYLNL